MRRNLKFQFWLDLKRAIFYTFFSQIPKLLKNYNFTSQITKHEKDSPRSQHFFHIDNFSKLFSLGVSELIDFMDTTPQKLREAGHKKGNCVCSECDRLRKLENKWILRLGTFFGDSGLNERNTINNAVRVQFWEDKTIYSCKKYLCLPSSNLIFFKTQT